VRSLSRECRVSGMEAPETVKDGSDAIGRRKPGRAGYRADGGKTPTPSCQTPFMQRPVSSLSARRSETKERNRGSSYRNLEPTSYNTHLPATAVPALWAGRRRLVSGGNRVSDPALVQPERGAVVSGLRDA